jgi:hypothetical protein
MGRGAADDRGHGLRMGRWQLVLRGVLGHVGGGRSSQQLHRRQHRRQQQGLGAGVIGCPTGAVAADGIRESVARIAALWRGWARLQLCVLAHRSLVAQCCKSQPPHQRPCLTTC